MSPEQIERVRALREMGFAWRAVEQRMGVSRETIVKAMPGDGGWLGVRPKAQRRPCLCCGVAFASEGPHNRLCGRCGKQSASPFVPFV